MIISKIRQTAALIVPALNMEKSMIPFCLKTLKGLSDEFKALVEPMVAPLQVREGMAFLTVHGRNIQKDDTLRRPGAHIDGNYMNYEPGQPFKSFGSGGGNGWKLGQTGPYIEEQEHLDSYENEKGGIIMVSNFQSCKAYAGEFEGSPGRGGDCTHIKLNEGFHLEPNKVYYGNNRMVHESLPVSEDTQRTLIRITLPITHEFEELTA
jgi:hypothetical protein